MRAGVPMTRLLARVASRAGLVLCGSFCGLAAPSWAADDCSTSTTDTGFAEVVFDTTSGTFGGVLPFDVPVRVCAVVPEGTTKATVCYAANERRKGPLNVGPNCDCADRSSIPWSPQTERAPAPNGTTVRWLIDRLEPERYYAFCFGFEKKATDEEIAAFQTRALAVLDEGIGRLQSATLTPQQTQQICEDLRGRLLAVTGTERILTRGTVFDCAPAQVGAFAARITRGVLEPQRRAEQALAGLPQQQAGLQAELATLQSTQALSHLLELVDQQAALDPAVDARVKSLCPTCTELVGPTAVPASQLAVGADILATAAPAPLAPGSDPAQASTMAKSYEATDANLKGLSQLIAWATTGEGAATVGAGLDAAERTALVNLTQAGGTLEKANGLAFTLRGQAQNLARQLAARAQALAARADELKVDARSVVLADASTLGNFTTNQANYISLDTGFVWAPELDEIVPYAGTNFYLRPVNKNAPLRTLGNFRQTFSRRFAFTLGLTASSIADENDNAGQARDDLFGSQSLLAGAGLRITDSIRLGAGAVVFKRLDPDPLVDESELYSSWYLTLSFDIDIVNLLSPALGSALNTTKPAPR
jgi:hypothetical protein